MEAYPQLPCISPNASTAPTIPDDVFVVVAAVPPSVAALPKTSL